MPELPEQPETIEEVNEHQPLIDAFLNAELNEEAVASTLGTPYILEIR